MPFTALTLLGLAIVSWRFTQHHPDDVGKFLGLGSTLICLVASLMTAPLVLQGLMLVGLLVYPVCSTQTERSLQPNCPRLCLWRYQCQPSKKQN